jgi:hypothetical protein
VAARPENVNVQVRGMSMITGSQDDFGESFGHEHYYYFHRMRPMRHTMMSQSEIFDAYLYNPDEQRPVLIDKQTYLDLRRRSATESPSVPSIDLEDGVLLLLPGPYAVCSTNVASRAVER